MMTQSPDMEFSEDLFHCEPNSYPPWRKEAEVDGPHKSVADMIKDIVMYRERYREHKRKEKENSTSTCDALCLEAKFNMTLSFIEHTNVEEDIGTKDKHNIEDIIRTIRENYQQSAGAGKRRKIWDKSEEETAALYQGIKYLEQMAKEEKQKDPETLGLMEETVVRELHTILMKDVIKDTLTPAGQYSLEERKTQLDKDGKMFHNYPRYSSQSEWEEKVRTVIDRYNDLVHFVIGETDKEKRLLNLFKCASFLLFELISLHPFSDGNGRLCRLLGSYTLRTLTPFESPIYNIYSPTRRDDYVNCIISARESESKHPRDLTTLMIESNWFAWRHFLQSVNLSSVIK